MRWSELSEEERDRLVHTKVTGKDPDELCSDLLCQIRYGEWYCTKCGHRSTLEDQRDFMTTEEMATGKQHKAMVPHYSTDMNAAISALLHIGRKFEFVYNPNPVAGSYKLGCKIEPASDNGWSAIGLSDDPIEAINFAALKACGVEIDA